MKIAFTGHRPDKLDGDYKLVSPLINTIKNKLTNVLVVKKPELTINGMAQGIDQLSALICMEIGIPFIAAVPFEGQEKLWPPKAQEEYHRILSHAIEVVIVSPGMYSSKKMDIRNRWMVDNISAPGDLLVAVWDGSSGGTRNCIKYAETLGREILRFNPNDYRENLVVSNNKYYTQDRPC